MSELCILAHKDANAMESTPPLIARPISLLLAEQTPRKIPAFDYPRQRRGSPPVQDNSMLKLEIHKIP
jgi:hypothetical protein